jgi:hypothetical protein
MALRAMLVLFALVIAASRAEAVTIRDIIALSNAGLSDEILSAVIDADRTIFTLDAEQILELRRAGVSDAVLLKMVRSRREFDAPPPLPPTTTEAVADEIGPQVVIIGGDSRKDEPHADHRGAYGVFDGPYYFVPFPLWGTGSHRSPRAPAAPFISPEQRGFGRFMNDGWVGRR